MLGCFQRVLLYGGVVLSVGILVATMSGLWADYREHVSRQRASFLTARSMLNIELHAHQAAFARTVTSAELIWAEFPKGRQDLVDAFASNGGRQILAANPHAAPLLALGELGAARSASAYARYLALTERMGSVMRAAGGRPGQHVAACSTARTNPSRRSTRPSVPNRCRRCSARPTCMHGSTVWCRPRPAYRFSRMAAIWPSWTAPCGCRRISIR